MRSWRAACVTWQKRDDQLAARTAHIDAKMDERERRRERRASSFARKPADNYIKPTEADLEEVRRDYDF